MAERVLKSVKRAIVFVVGGTVVLLGVVMVVLPGPAILVVPIGLGILATEFVWARHLLAKFKEQSKKIYDKVSPSRP